MRRPAPPTIPPTTDPASANRVEDASGPPPQNVHLIVTVKDEAPYLVEFIAHHRLLGATGFTFVSNDCSDGTDALLDRLADLGVVTHFSHDPPPDVSPQMRAYQIAWEEGPARRADWVMTTDADEFLTISAGGGTYADLIAASEAAAGAPVDAISLNWRLMGSAGLRGYEDVPVTRRFRRGGRVPAGTAERHRAVKTLFRPRRFDTPGLHRPHLNSDTPRTAQGDLVWVNGSGRRLSHEFVEGRAIAMEVDQMGWDNALLFHYSVKSRGEFLAKRARGTGMLRSRGRVNESYWAQADRNGLITFRLPLAGLDDEIATLMADPEVARLHREAVALHQSRIDPLLAQDDVPPKPLQPPLNPPKPKRKPSLARRLKQVLSPYLRLTRG